MSERISKTTKARSPRRATAATTSVSPRPTKLEPTTNRDYDAFLEYVKAVFARVLADGGSLFTTDATGLYEAYLGALSSERDIHTCRTCERFIESFGGLVTIDVDGTTVPALWNGSMQAPEFYRASVASLCRKVKHAHVTGVFLSEEAALGQAVTGNWTHLAVTLPKALVYESPDMLDADQGRALKKENFGCVERALAEFTVPRLDTALSILNTEKLNMSERFIAPVTFLRDLHIARAEARGVRGADNVMWRAIATAPNAFCHPRTSMSGTLLTDIANNLPFDQIKRRFNKATAGDRFQRPQAAPSAGNIVVAERLVEQLGLAPSLERRFARVAELPAVWTPRKATRTAAPVPAVSSVFGHLAAAATPSKARAPVLPLVTMTWEKFARTVLASAETIQMKVPAHGAFMAFTTAVHPDAPPLLKWDRPEERNPFGWYVYHEGSSAAQWRLRPDAFCNVNAVVPLPTMWGERPLPHEGEGVLLALDGAQDTSNVSACLFPQILREELREVRSTIEAFSNKGRLGGHRAPGNACGYDIRKTPQAINVTLKVMSHGQETTYRIDRWD